MPKELGKLEVLEMGKNTGGPPPEHEPWLRTTGSGSGYVSRSPGARSGYGAGEAGGGGHAVGRPAPPLLADTMPPMQYIALKKISPI